jgi:hypothetical protein
MSPTPSGCTCARCWARACPTPSGCGTTRWPRCCTRLSGQRVVVAAINRGWECYGIRDGFNGILFPERYPDGGVFRLTKERVRGIAHLGGTILGTTNRGNPLHFPMKMPDGSTKDVDRSGEILNTLR